MRLNIQKQKFGGIGYITSLSKTILDLYKNINQEDPTDEKNIMQSSYGKHYITKNHIEKELDEKLEDMKDKISKLLESNEESEIKKIITSAKFENAIILIRYLLREINNNKVQTEYKKNREEDITDIIHNIYSKMQIPVEEKEISQLTKELITILDSQKEKISQLTEEISQSTRELTTINELTTTLNSQKEKISQLTEEISQLNKELKTILDSKKKNTSLDKDNLFGILEIIYETCKDNDKFIEKLQETLDNKEFTQDTRNQLAQHIISICENIGNSQYKNLLYGVAFALKEPGAKIIRSPTKNPFHTQDPENDSTRGKTPEMFFAPPPPPLLQYAPLNFGFKANNTPPLPPKTSPCKVNTHPPSPKITSGLDPSLRLGPLEVDPTLKTARNLTSSPRKEDAHLQARYPRPPDPFTHRTSPQIVPSSHPKNLSPRSFSSNCAHPTHFTHIASPQIASRHDPQQAISRGVSPALNSGSSQAGGFTMRATLVWDAPPSHAQSESPSRPVNLNPHFRLGQNSPSQWQR